MLKEVPEFCKPAVGMQVLCFLWLCDMQVVFPTELDNSSMTFDASADMKRIGGPIALEAAEQQVTVQVYVDHSAVEVFLSSGEALATR